MSKGKTRKAWAAQARRKRNPDEWFAVPTEAATQKKNRPSAQGRTRPERGRNA